MGQGVLVEGGFIYLFFGGKGTPRPMPVPACTPQCEVYPVLVRRQGPGARKESSGFRFGAHLPLLRLKEVMESQEQCPFFRETQ